MNLIKDAEAVVKAGTGIQTKLIVGAGLAVILSLACLWMIHHYEDQGRTLERAIWLKKEADWNAATAKLIADNDAKIAKTVADNQAKERKTSELHEQEVAQVRADLDVARRSAASRGGLRIPAAVCANTGTAPASTEAPGASGRDAAGAGTVALPQQTQDDLWSIVGEADLVSAQLRACQGWIRLNGFYGNAQ